MLLKGLPLEADAERVGRVYRSGISFRRGADQGAPPTGFRQVHQRILCWRLPVSGNGGGGANGLSIQDCRNVKRVVMA